MINRFEHMACVPGSLPTPIVDTAAAQGIRPGSILATASPMRQRSLTTLRCFVQGAEFIHTDVKRAA